MTNSLDRLAVKIARLEKKVRRLGTQPQLGYSSFEGQILEYDADDNPTALIDPVGNRNEMFTGGYWVDPGAEPITWTEEERKKGQAWGLKTIESFHTHGTPEVKHK